MATLRWLTASLFKSKAALAVAVVASYIDFIYKRVTIRQNIFILYFFDFLSEGSMIIMVDDQ